MNIYGLKLPYQGLLSQKLNKPNMKSNHFEQNSSITTPVNNAPIKNEQNNNLETKQNKDSVTSKIIKNFIINSTMPNMGGVDAWNNFTNTIKSHVGEEWKYLSSKQYKNDSKEEDCIQDKTLSNTTAKICDDVYKKEQSTIDGWENINTVDNQETGFKAAAYKKDGKVIIAYCGTNVKKDFTSDAQMTKGEIPEQFKEADEYFQQISKDNEGCPILVTGHSLGGSLAELVASKNQHTAAVTFNAFGVNKIINSEKAKELNLKDNQNSYNYIIEGDPVSTSSKHVGETTLLKKSQANTHSISNYLNMWA